MLKFGIKFPISNTDGNLHLKNIKIREFFRCSFSVIIKARKSNANSCSSCTNADEVRQENNFSER